LLNGCEFFAGDSEAGINMRADIMRADITLDFIDDLQRIDYQKPLSIIQ
jgi:hypothetical protein